MGKRTNVALGAAVAAGVGYVAGILTAPKSGKETRHDINKAASKARAEAEKKLKQVHNELGDLLKTANAKIASGKLVAKGGMDKAIDVAVNARNKAREVLSAVHEGSAEDKELQKAIDDVNDALAHLKRFVKD